MNKVQSNFPRRAFFIPPSTMRDKTVQGVNQNRNYSHPLFYVKPFSGQSVLASVVL